MKFTYISILILNLFLLNVNSSAQVTNYSNILLDSIYKIQKPEDYFQDVKNVFKNVYVDGLDIAAQRKYDSLIRVVSPNLISDSIPLSSFVTSQFKVFNVFNHEDPHFRIFPKLRLKKGAKFNLNKKTELWPFTLLVIDSMIFVDESFCDELKKGDQIISVNNIAASEYLENSYYDRYMLPSTLQYFKPYSISSYYSVEHNRKGLIKTSLIKGIYPKNLVEFQDLKPVFYPNYDLGYLKINEFSFNAYIIKKIRKLCKKMNKNGVRKLLIDIRKNPGGNGNDFDKLFSIFINKDSIEYLKDVKMRISKYYAKAHSISADSINMVVSLPKEDVYHIIPLDKKLFQENIEFYILVSKNTASMAASFANMLQYHNGAILLGEDLQHNALKYGEVSMALLGGSYVSFSTVQFYEYTKAKNGILSPDIHIPYVAKEYMQGGDPVLEKCLEYIKNNTKYKCKKIN